jgi:hypothetical protein
LDLARELEANLDLYTREILRLALAKIRPTEKRRTYIRACRAASWSTP